MALIRKWVKIVCPKCERSQDYNAVQVADVVEEPELKQKIFASELNVFNCIDCESKLHYDQYLLYSDSVKGFLVNVFSRDYTVNRQDIAQKIIKDISELSVHEMHPNYIVFGYASLARSIALLDRELSFKKEHEIAEMTHDDYRKLFVLGEEWINSRQNSKFEDKLDAISVKFKNALAMQNDGNIENAIATYNAIIDELPGYYPARFNLGLLLFNNSSDYESSFSHFSECAKLRPNDSECAFAMGQVLVKLGKVDEAVGYFANAVVVQPSNSLAWFNFGLTLVMNGKKDEGVDAMERSLDLSDSADDKTIIAKTISSVMKRA